MPRVPRARPARARRAACPGQLVREPERAQARAWPATRRAPRGRGRGGRAFPGRRELHGDLVGRRAAARAKSRARGRRARAAIEQRPQPRQRTRRAPRARSRRARGGHVVQRRHGLEKSGVSSSGRHGRHLSVVLGLRKSLSPPSSRHAQEFCAAGAPSSSQLTRARGAHEAMSSSPLNLLSQLFSGFGGWESSKDDSIALVCTSTGTTPKLLAWWARYHLGVGFGLVYIYVHETDARPGVFANVCREMARYRDATLEDESDDLSDAGNDAAAGRELGTVRRALLGGAVYVFKALVSRVPRGVVTLQVSRAQPYARRHARARARAALNHLAGGQRRRRARTGAQSRRFVDVPFRRRRAVVRVALGRDAERRTDEARADAPSAARASLFRARSPISLPRGLAARARLLNLRSTTRCVRTYRTRVREPRLSGHVTARAGLQTHAPRRLDLQLFQSRACVQAASGRSRGQRPGQRRQCRRAMVKRARARDRSGDGRARARSISS